MCSILWSMYPPPWPSCKLFILFTGYCLFKEPIRCKVDASVTSTYGNRPYLLSAHLYIISRINSIFIRWLLLMKTSCMQRVVKFNRTTISTPKSIAAQVLGILVAFTCFRLTLCLQVCILKPIQSQAFPNSNMIQSWNHLSWSLHLYHLLRPSVLRHQSLYLVNQHFQNYISISIR